MSAAVSGTIWSYRYQSHNLIEYSPVDVCPSSPGRRGNLRFKATSTKAESPKVALVK